MKTLANWLSDIDQQASITPTKKTKSLETITIVANSLGLLPVDHTVITVAGTNGKGSTANLLASIYQNSGYKTGLYTSPHLLRFNERITVNNTEINDSALINNFEKIHAVLGDKTLNYYEYATLAALLYFKEQKIDIAILEVGLGGRLDATNIIDPDLAVITTIELDHTEWLGENREMIGFEKSGILRPNVPAVCGDLDCPQSVLQTALRLKVPLFRQQEDFFALVSQNQWEWRCVDEGYSKLPIPQIPVQNASTALMVVRCLKEYFPVNKEAIEKALITTRVLGRYQIFQLKCPVILDVAHNPSAAHWLSEKIKKVPCKGKTIGVFSVLSDKDVVNIISQLEPQVYRWFYAPLPLERALSAEELDAAFDYSKYRRRAESIEEALEKALAIAEPEDRIVAFGSIYVASHLLPILQKKAANLSAK